MPRRTTRASNNTNNNNNNNNHNNNAQRQQQGQHEEDASPSSSPAAAPAAPVAAGSSRTATGPGQQQLRFNASLSWRVGKAPNIGEILKRLQALAAELKELDQDEVGHEALAGPAHDLASPSLIQHKDAGVRAWTACCLADVFRLRAPEAPFTAKQLKDVFSFFITSIFPALSDPHNPYNTQHVYVIGTLSQVKCLILLTDINGANNLILNLFETCFDILSATADELSKNVEYSMTGILESMVDESQELPPEVIEIMLAQFLRADPRASSAHSSKHGKRTLAKSAVDANQSTLQRHLPPAYNLAKNICNTCVDRMARYVSHYFSNVITNASTSSSAAKPPHASSKRRNSTEEPEPEDEEGKGLSEEGLEQLEKAHRLLRELWRSAPGVLQNVIPQVEAELSMESIQLRLLATEAMGDMVSGIGSAGPPKSPALDPSAYPSSGLDRSDEDAVATRDLTTPSSPQSFIQTHPSAFQSFVSRKNDKSPLIRAAWTSGMGRILSTSAGGSGLDSEQERTLAKQLSQMLVDGDEKVRIAAVEAAGLFTFRGFIDKLGALGPVSENGSFLKNLSDRVKDRKHTVRSEAISLLGKLWGVSVGEIAAGNEHIQQLMGPIPSKILDAAYVNDADINALIDQTMFESFIPMGYPAMKKKEKQNQGAKRGTAKGADETPDVSERDEDKIRVERILLLVNSLDDRARPVMMSLMARPTTLSTYMDAFLKRCEEYNGGVMDKNEEEIQKYLRRLIEFLAKPMPDAARVAEDLSKFAKAHDRRSYSLIRFCMAIDSDYKKVFKSMKELRRRIDGLAPNTGTTTMMSTLQALLWKVSNIFYNKSHIHPIMAFSQTNEKNLGASAQELIHQISAKCPRVFKAHSEELCHFLMESAPTKEKTNDVGTLEALKACATFARGNANDITKDRKFLQSMMQYALRGTPPACAKHAVSIFMACSDTKAMHAKDLLKQCVKGFEYGSEHFLAKLAAMSQLMLLASPELDEEKDIDPVVDIAINHVLSQVRIPEADLDSGDWQPEPDEESSAKVWAMKILVNRLRAHNDAQSVRDVTEPVYQLLNTLIKTKGELSRENPTPKCHRSRLRLQAALLHLKLCEKRGFENCLVPAAFNRLATVAQDPLFQVRERFVTKVKKYLGSNRLPSRFYAVVFLLAFEPTQKLREDSVIWLRSRAKTMAKADHTSIGVLFTRLLSLLAHHPDFDKDDADDVEDFVQYITFFLKAMATEENLSLLYHAAQRVKSVQDGIDPASSENLYCLSDLAQAVIRRYEELQNWSMQAYSGKLELPARIFAPLPDHKTAQAIANKQFLPPSVVDRMDAIIKGSVKSSRKRKPDVDPERASKRRATSSSQHNHAAATTNGTNHKLHSVRKSGSSNKGNKTPTKKKRKTVESDDAPSSERRRSGRHVTGERKSYAESSADNDDDDDDDGTDEETEARD